MKITRIWTAFVFLCLITASVLVYRACGGGSQQQGGASQPSLIQRVMATAAVDNRTDQEKCKNKLISFECSIIGTGVKQDKDIINPKGIQRITRVCEEFDKCTTDGSALPEVKIVKETIQRFDVPGNIADRPGLLAACECTKGLDPDVTTCTPLSFADANGGYTGITTNPNGSLTVKAVMSFESIKEKINPRYKLCQTDPNSQCLFIYDEDRDRAWKFQTGWDYTNNTKWYSCLLWYSLDTKVYDGCAGLVRTETCESYRAGIDDGLLVGDCNLTNEQLPFKKRLSKDPTGKDLPAPTCLWPNAVW